MKKLQYDNIKLKTIKYMPLREYKFTSFCSENNIEEAIGFIKDNSFNITHIYPQSKSYLLCDSLFVRLKYEEITIRK